MSRMSDLSKVVSEQRFINAFNICYEYCEKSEKIADVNFRLIKNHLLNLSETQITSFYHKFIESELIYGLPELHSCDIVTIPKKSTGVREYRFFSVFSMILYNAIGLIFVDSCNDVINTLNFTKKSIFPYYPTKFVLNKDSISEKDKWKVKNNYKDEFNKFQQKLEEYVTVNVGILQLDLTQYFESIIHEKLIELVFKFSNKSTLSKNNLINDSATTLEFFFEALMCRRFSIPQGKKNFVSDYLGYLYLVPFDMIVEELCANSNLKFKGMIRYVDDITIIFENDKSLSADNVYRHLLEIESKVINWFLNELGLTINASKTVRKYILTKKEKINFIKANKKSTSGIDLSEKSETLDKKTKSLGSKFISSDIQITFNNFLGLLSKFKFPKKGTYSMNINKDDFELMKVLFDNKGFQNYILKKENIKKIKDALEKVEVELTVDYINLLIVLYSLKKKENYEFIYILEEFFKKYFQPDDKRHLHILHVLHAQNSYDKQQINKLIKKNKDKIKYDNYGKYLLLLAEVEIEKMNYHELDNRAIYNRIGNEFKQPSVYRTNYLFKNESEYLEFIKILLENFHGNKSISDQLKYYVLYTRQKKWDLAFNCFHNIFHEISKKKFGLDDKANVKNVIEKSKELSLEDQLIIDKFYNRRNFNLISHPGQKGIPSEKVNHKDLNEFEIKILLIIMKLYRNKK